MSKKSDGLSDGFRASGLPVEAVMGLRMALEQRAFVQHKNYGYDRQPVSIDIRWAGKRYTIMGETGTGEAKDRVGRISLGDEWEYDHAKQKYIRKAPTKSPKKSVRKSLRIAPKPKATIEAKSKPKTVPTTPKMVRLEHVPLGNGSTEKTE